MSHYRIIAGICLAGWLPLNAGAQNAVKDLRQGNKLYNQEKYEEAEGKYQKALDKEPASDKGLYNQGNALYQQEKFEDARKNYEITAEMFDDPVKKAQAYHNLGNTYYKSGDWEKSVEAYKNALRTNPKDDETRYNLALAQSKLRQQQQQQNQDQNQENKDQQDQDKQNQDQKDQQNQDQQNQDQQQQDQQNQDQQQQNKEGDQNQDQQQQGDQGEEGDQDQQQMPQPSKLSKEEVERILQALSNDENKVQEKIIRKKTPANPTRVDKDW